MWIALACSPDVPDKRGADTAPVADSQSDSAVDDSGDDSGGGQGPDTAADSAADSAPDSADTGPGDTATPGDPLLAVLEGDASADHFGMELAGVPDADGDGLDDLVVGAPYGDDAFGAPVGTASLYAGASTLLQVVAGEASYDYLGSGLGAGDIDGDGVVDLVVGVVGHDAGGADAGAVWVVAAGATEPWLQFDGPQPGAYLGVRVAVGDLDGDGVDDAVGGAANDDAGAADAGGALAWGARGQVARVTGDEPGAYLGIAVAAADLDGDGVDDLVLGGSGEGTGNDGAGDVLVFAGPLADDVFPADAVLHLAGSGTDHLGNAVAAGEDLDGDGYLDLAAAAYWESSLSPRGGAVYVFAGPIAGSEAPASATGVVRGEEEYGYGGIRVAMLRDATGDGLADLLVGEYYAPLPDDPEVHPGAAHVVAGPVEGTRYLREATYTVRGEAHLDAFGYSVAAGGDVDGGGLTDLLVGAYQADGNRGRAYVYSAERLGR